MTCAGCGETINEGGRYLYVETHLADGDGDGHYDPEAPQLDGVVCWECAHDRSLGGMTWRTS